jgi:hypothetical protein
VNRALGYALIIILHEFILVFDWYYQYISMYIHVVTVPQILSEK